MSAKLHAAYVGKTVRVLVDGESDDPEYPLTSRTEGNRLVGIISHVQELKARIEKQIVVTKEKAGGSRVELKID